MSNTGAYNIKNKLSNYAVYNSTRDFQEDSISDERN